MYFSLLLKFGLQIEPLLTPFINHDGTAGFFCIFTVTYTVSSTSNIAFNSNFTVEADKFNSPNLKSGYLFSTLLL